MGDGKDPFDEKFLPAPWGGAVLGALGGFLAVGWEKPVTLVIAMLIGALFLGTVHAVARRTPN